MTENIIVKKCLIASSNFLREMSGIMEDKAEKVSEMKKKKVQYKCEKKPESRKKSSVFMLFCKARRPELVKEIPEIARNVKEMAKKLGEEWRSLPKDMKEIYYEKVRRESGIDCGLLANSKKIGKVS